MTFTQGHGSVKTGTGASAPNGKGEEGREERVGEGQGEGVEDKD